ncbi:hypothetical protein HUJ04_008001 [Dendroctonus ponderosae]|nr:hypothetical protein HUJ04_008001 [Dendroctonus ponderosae]
METLNYSRRSIAFFKPILLVSSLFGLVPPYDFSEKKLVLTKCYIGYTLVLKGVLLYSMTVGFGNKYQNLPSGQSQLFFAFSTLVMVLGGATILQVMTCSYQSRLKWQDLLQRLSFLESATFLNTENEKEPNIFKNALLHFLFGNIFLAITIMAYYFFFDELDASDGFRIAMFFYNFTISMIINNLCVAIKLKFAGAHEKLKSCKHAQFHNAIEITRKCRIIYHEMYLIVDIMNGIFGPTIFLMHFLYGIQVLEVSTTLFVHRKSELDLQSQPNFAIVLVLSVLFLCIPVITTMCCDFAKREAQTLLKTCRDLQRPLDIFTKRHQELEDFMDQMNNTRIEFLAFRCFEVNRKAIILLLTVTSNHFIVIVQFLNTS